MGRPRARRLDARRPSVCSPSRSTPCATPPQSASSRPSLALTLTPTLTLALAQALTLIRILTLTLTLTLTQASSTERLVSLDIAAHPLLARATASWLSTSLDHRSLLP